jgi:ABC-type Fe3+/spermidine/putrescine transport system ATPase subunit
MTVLENVAFGLKMRRMSGSDRRRRAEGMLELVDLTGMGDRKPHQLSGGQRQRVALARSLVIEPDVLLLDEPLGALDALIRRQMQSELLALQRRLGLTFLYVTHDQEEAMAMSDRLAVMHAGRIAQIGTPADVYRRPRTEFVARFLGECNLLPARIGDAVDGGAAVEADLLGRLAVAGDRIPPGLPRGADCLATLRPEDIAITSASAGREVGRVTERAYLGARTRFVVDAGGHRVIVQVDGRSDHGVGDEIGLGWEDDAVCLVEPERDPAELAAVFSAS